MRLAAGARSPQSSIRPLVKPLLTHVEFPPEPLEIGTEEIFAPPMREARAEDARSTKPRPPEPRPAEPPPRETVTAAPLELRPDMASATPETISAPVALQHPIRSPVQQAPDVRAESVFAISYQPLMHESERVRYDFTPVKNRRGPQQAAPVRDANRGPDEINIHIGRIELTAAPPSAPAPRVPNKPRKSVSLDEYLTRGRR
jgi:hypothetical protein